MPCPRFAPGLIYHGQVEAERLKRKKKEKKKKNSASWSIIKLILASVENQEEAVQSVVEFMDAYSLSQEDFDSILELSRFQVCGNL